MIQQISICIIPRIVRSEIPRCDRDCFRLALQIKRNEETGGAGAQHGRVVYCGAPEGFYLTTGTMITVHAITSFHAGGVFDLEPCIPLDLRRGDHAPSRQEQAPVSLLIASPLPDD